RLRGHQQARTPVDAALRARMAIPLAARAGARPPREQAPGISRHAAHRASLTGVGPPPRGAAERACESTSPSASTAAREVIPTYIQMYAQGFVRFAKNSATASASIPKTNPIDRKITRLNSSHVAISYAVFCLK